MKWVLLVLGVAACGAGDDTVEGSRAACATGGVLNDCPDSAQTPAAACMRLVECAAIPLSAPMDYQFDWDRCVDILEGVSDASQRLVTSCIAASSCDALRVSRQNDPDPSEMPCLRMAL